MVIWWADSGIDTEFFFQKGALQEERSAAKLQGEWLGKARGSFFPLRGVLRLRIGVRCLRNLEGPRRRGPTRRNWCGTIAVTVIREERCCNAQRFYFDSQVLHLKLG